MISTGSFGIDMADIPVRGNFGSDTEPCRESVSLRLIGRRFCFNFESFRRSSNSCEDARSNLVRKHNGIRS